MSGSSNKTLLWVAVSLAIVSIVACLVSIFLLFKGRTLFSRMHASPGQKLQLVLSHIGANYVDSISMRDMEEKALPIILKQLDPHSEYLSAEMMSAANEPLKGNFDGIGVTFNMLSDTIIIQSVIPGGPSERVGLQNGDRIILVDGDTVAGRSIRQDSIVKRLRGERGTSVSVAVERAGGADLIPFDIVRDKIPINSVEVAYMADSVTGLIRISRFAQTTPAEFSEAVLRLAVSGMQRLIVDLRGNGGGFLEAAHFIASQFLHEDQLIVYTQGRARGRSELLSIGEGPLRNIPLAILIDEFSASASEIVAGAVQDNDRGVIVGRRSFGKGLVQEQIAFSDGSGLRLTTARYYTPSGRSIQKPYTMGDMASYDEELEERWLHGEFLAEDSIQQDTLQRFYTVGGRPVYGGGGIMPDLFVPLDTVGDSHFYRQVTRRAMQIRFAQRYLDANREKLALFGRAEEMLEYLESQNLLSDFLQYAASQKVTPKPGDLKRSSEVILTQIYAHIARATLEEEGYARIIQSIDVTLQEALRLLRDPNPLQAAGQ